MMSLGVSFVGFPMGVDTCLILLRKAGSLFHSCSGLKSDRTYFWSQPFLVLDSLPRKLIDRLISLIHLRVSIVASLLLWEQVGIKLRPRHRVSISSLLSVVVDWLIRILSLRSLLIASLFLNTRGLYWLPIVVIKFR